MNRETVSITSSYIAIQISGARTVSLPSFQINKPTGPVSIAAQSVTLTDIGPEILSFSGVLSNARWTLLASNDLQNTPSAWDDTGGGHVPMAIGTDYEVNYQYGAFHSLRGGADFPFSSNYTGMKRRYDLIWANPLDGTIGKTDGIARYVDPEEYIPRAPAGMIPLFGVLFYNRNTMELIPICLYDRYCKIGEESAFDRDKSYQQSCMPKLMRLARNGDPITLAIVGDSQVAAGGTAAMSDPVMNVDGDQIGAYPRYPADTQATFPQAGGKALINFHHVLANEITKRYGSAVTIKNFGINGTSSADALNSTRLSYLAAAGADAVLLATGTNEMGVIGLGSSPKGSTGVGANTAAFIDAVRGMSGSPDVMVIGCPQGNTLLAPLNPVWISQPTWRGTVESQIRAARGRDAAFVNTYDIFDDDRIGCTGLSRRTLGTTDGFHMGRQDRFHIGNFAAQSFI